MRRPKYKIGDVVEMGPFGMTGKIKKIRLIMFRWAGQIKVEVEYEDTYGIIFKEREVKWRQK